MRPTITKRRLKHELTVLEIYVEKLTRLRARTASVLQVSSLVSIAESVFVVISLTLGTIILIDIILEGGE